MKKVLSVVLALFMLCSLALIASAEPRRFSVIDNTLASASRSVITFEESAAYDWELGLYEEYSLNENDKVVFTFTAGGESYVETCYVH